MRAESPLRTNTRIPPKLTSIVKKGNGKSYISAWPVIQIEEEEFNLEMLGAKLLKQSIENDCGVCDKMEVEIDGNKKPISSKPPKSSKGTKNLNRIKSSQ